MAVLQGNVIPVDNSIVTAAMAKESPLWRLMQGVSDLGRLGLGIGEAVNNANIAHNKQVAEGIAAQNQAQDKDYSPAASAASDPMYAANAANLLRYQTTGGYQQGPKVSDIPTLLTQTFGPDYQSNTAAQAIEKNMQQAFGGKDLDQAAYNVLANTLHEFKNPDSVALAQFAARNNFFKQGDELQNAADQLKSQLPAPTAGQPDPYASLRNLPPDQFVKEYAKNAGKHITAQGFLSDDELQQANSQLSGAPATAGTTQPPAQPAATGPATSAINPAAAAGAVVGIQPNAQNLAQPGKTTPEPATFRSEPGTAPGYQDIKNNPNSPQWKQFQANIPQAYQAAPLLMQQSLQLSPEATKAAVRANTQLGDNPSREALVATGKDLIANGWGPANADPTQVAQQWMSLREAYAHTADMAYVSGDQTAFSKWKPDQVLYRPSLAGGAPTAAPATAQAGTPTAPVASNAATSAAPALQGPVAQAPTVATHTILGPNQDDLLSGALKQSTGQTLTPAETAAMNGNRLTTTVLEPELAKNINGVNVTMNDIARLGGQPVSAYTKTANMLSGRDTSISELISNKSVTDIPSFLNSLSNQQKQILGANQDARLMVDTALKYQDFVGRTDFQNKQLAEMAQARAATAAVEHERNMVMAGHYGETTPGAVGTGAGTTPGGTAAGRLSLAQQRLNATLSNDQVNQARSTMTETYKQLADLKLSNGDMSALMAGTNAAKIADIEKYHGGVTQLAQTWRDANKLLGLATANTAAQAAGNTLAVKQAQDDFNTAAAGAGKPTAAQQGTSTTSAPGTAAAQPTTPPVSSAASAYLKSKGFAK